MASVPKINVERLWSDIISLGEITDPALPYTRRSFSPLFDEGRAMLSRRMAEAGLTVRVDAAGNLIGRRDGRLKNAPAIAMGSHSDTVPAGGRFDGIAGVVAAIEVARAIAESGHQTRHPIEVIDFLAEEPSAFGLSCIGSRGMASQLDGAMLAMIDGEGRVLADALRAVGGEPDIIATAGRNDLAAFLELHIEQGPVLENKNIPIGVVSSIVGIRRIEIEFEGMPAHAGTAPMNLRQDAGYAGALTNVAVRQHAEAFSVRDDRYFVATTGIMLLHPGGSNVVPGRCKLVIDVRSSDAALIEEFTEILDRESLFSADLAKVRRISMKLLSDGVPAHCDQRIRSCIRDSAVSLGCPALDIASGAGHDAAFIATICPVGMIFIPCLRGMSHTPDEYSTADELGTGAAVMLEAVLRLDAMLIP